MVKMILLAAIVLAIGGLLSFVVMAAISRKGTAPGLVDGKLAPLPETPNAHFQTVPLPDGTTADASASLKAALQQLPGTTIVTEEGTYLAAESRTGLLGFVDDIEVLVREEDREVDIRSASRIGHSDLGANEARIARLRELWTAAR